MPSLNTPTEASKQLGLQTSRLRSYVTYFPELFSDYAKRSKNRRYTASDIAVFQRVATLGDHVMVLRSAVDQRRIDVQFEQGRASPQELTEALSAVQDRLGELRAEVRAYAAVSRAEWAVLADWLTELEARIESSGVQPTEGRYRLSRQGSKWHWCRECSNFPKGDGMIVQARRPSVAELCRQCLARERAGACEG